MPHVIPARAEKLTRALLEPLRRYHRFETEGLEHVPREGAAMVVMHHSLATYDAFLIGADVLEKTGRQPLGLGDDNLFKIPGVRGWCHDLGIRPARPETGEQLLRDGELLMLAPGGTREALRPHTQRYQSLWHDRLGFARLALRTGVPVLVAGCPAADRIYKVYPSRVTRAVYRKTRWPLPIARGVGPTAVPRPVRLTGYIGAPVVPPRDADPDDPAVVKAFHQEVTAAMAALLRQGAS